MFDMPFLLKKMPMQVQEEMGEPTMDINDEMWR